MLGSSYLGTFGSGCLGLRGLSPLVPTATSCPNRRETDVEAAHRELRGIDDKLRESLPRGQLRARIRGDRGHRSLVTGTLPETLSGRYLRNGPNPLVPPEPSKYHWFVGDGMVHGIRIRGGRAEWYRNRWVRSSEVAKALGEPVRPGPMHADMDFAPNTNVIEHAGRTFAIVAAGPRPYEVTYELDTLGPSDFDGTLPGGYSAHPKRDPATGELHAICYFWGGETWCSIR